ncbi:hypothetical protein CAPTEDRAFT_200903 [Capitella teleta]|uniref:G-protein coupled receptors family 1 profile domain-containing protein n=1 Tax=Capitella teleta TaxID=283909 RepID=R7U6G4_CAPTE|nr:hypothetical protein CAPTEDRAFT_200903 [Capitella teleta]|eukprot:ELU01721.1 hypothetical protein CAPTEDRAFT_200903 [Capitella teleta]
MSYPYAMSLACGDLINCMLVMPTAVINAYIGDLPGEVLLCRVWLAVDLWLTASMGLHLCLLAVDLCLLLVRRSPTCFSAQSTCSVRLKLVTAWGVSGATALGPLLWNLLWTPCPSRCVPSGAVFGIVSTSACFAMPASLLAVTCVISHVMLKRNWAAYTEVSGKAQRASQREKEIQTLQQAVNNFTSISADVDLHSMLSTDRDDNVTKEPSLMRKLSRRLSSRRAVAAAAKTEAPSSPKLDRHPSLRYSIKRGGGPTQGSQRSIRGSMQRKEKSEGGCTMPLLLPSAGSALSVDSKDYSNDDDSGRTPEELDDRTICNMLLAENPPQNNRSSFKRRSGSHRGSKRQSKKSLGAPPSSPTLDRHPSLRYSIKRPRTPRADADGKKSSSFKRSPSTRSQRSFFSRTPSVRSNVSRTPSQHSQCRTPYNRSPQILKMTSLAADYPMQQQQPPPAQQTTDTVFAFPEPSMLSSREASPLLNTRPNEINQPIEIDTETPETPSSGLRSPVVTLQAATPTKSLQSDANGRSGPAGSSRNVVEPTAQEGMLMARANSIESLDGGDAAVDGETLRSQRRVLHVLGALSVCFVVTHLPSYVTMVLESACQERHAPHCAQPAVFFALQWIAYMCSLLNPVVFFAFHKELIQKLRP